MRARYSPARGLHLLIYTTTIPHVRHYILHRPHNCRSVRPRQSSSASPCVTTTEQNGKTCFNGYVLCDESKCKCIIYFYTTFHVCVIFQPVFGWTGSIDVRREIEQKRFIFFFKEIAGGKNMRRRASFFRGI